MNTTTSYPYSVGDSVMIGIVTWQHPRAEIPEGPINTWGSQVLNDPRYRTPAGPSGPVTRYFITGIVEANDREAGRLVVRIDHDDRLDIFEFDEFNGEEVVAFDLNLPQTPADAHARALRGEIN